MESATIKLSNVVVFNRRLHFSPLIQHLHHHSHFSNPRPQCPKFPALKSNPNHIVTLPRSYSRFSSSLTPPSTNPLAFFLSTTAAAASSFHFNDYVNLKDATIRSKEQNDDSVYSWNRAAEGVDEGWVGDLRSRNRVATVVLLGWLGAEMRHLRRYAEVYNAQGIHAVKFVVPVKELLHIDLGRRVERRIEVLVNELEAWVNEAAGGDDRCFIFHTFSNTGWLVYGAILDHWKDKPELTQKIKGCVVDSGGDPELNPKVWAAGFSAAILKKRSSLTKPSRQRVGAYESNSEAHKGEVQGKESDLLESMVMSVLKKLFSVLLNVPDVNKRLMKIIVRLSEKPPSCPQLYLYSTADKVIPYQSVESFMEIQVKKGIDVESFNFQSSPHVDHFRTFPDLYTSVLHNFLKKCLSQTK